ncbi:urease accessory protein UreD [Aliirhizobium cellulosilyticum]|uniref:Urease accessory protein UreD n=1 Tax=Aliirhizobium cellulosilyticum TaxID=393664 RepID=A0A7W6TE73_9HYPH|nr:urease accessory protein [Rhizobium cellulosilyticum]MBB4410675.1 urease accessory protein [Rhizobium cellulosilyticum]MBB4445363.1 urease accessory protein [Rhizobium cellulosilyticum]
MQHSSVEHYAPQRARGSGRLVTKAFDGRTRLDEFFQEGCAKIRLPETFSPEMEAILINTSGGLTGGDVIDWSVAAAASTRLSVATQANEKIYKASSGTASVSTHITVGDNASVHWLPQETILFDRASLSRRLDVDLAESAEFLAVEAVLLGRRAMGEAVANGFFRDRWRVRRNAQLIHAEEMRFEGEIAQMAQAAAVLSGQVAFATLFHTGPLSESMLPKLRECIGNAGGASYWNGKLIARIAAPTGFDLRKILVPAISVLRNGAPVPKVWHI